MTWLLDGPWLSVFMLSVLVLAVFHRPLLWAGKVLVRSLVGLGFLALWAHSGVLAGLSLGVNLFNALTLGLLGVPGFGLLMLLKWIST
ncbi:MAG: pro-sigmaK processing inhibitor BofA family protein [Ruminiclostridium sp.]|nr:pro-sigmaK processing inhibitor BofA family protein [Ruminiclostridium sp.]